MSAGSTAKPAERDWREFEMGILAMCGSCGAYYRAEVAEETPCPLCSSVERAGYAYTHGTPSGHISISPAMLDQLVAAANKGR